MSPVKAEDNIKLIEGATKLECVDLEGCVLNGNYVKTEEPAICDDLIKLEDSSESSGTCTPDLNGNVLSEVSSVDQSPTGEEDQKTGSRKHRGRRARPRRKAKKATPENSDTEVKPIVPRPVAVKNAVMMLNEMYPPPAAPQYKVMSQVGPPNNPIFTMVCTIMEQSFTGTGKSKKEAKLACSQKALEDMCGLNFPSQDDTLPSLHNPRSVSEIDDWMELEGKNPVSILNEMYPGITYQLISTQGPSHMPEFIMRVSLGSVSFDGIGKSKKDAKLHASKALLVHLHKVGFDPASGNLMPGQANNSLDADYADGHSWADKVGRMVTAQFAEVFSKTTYGKRKVLAGVVMAKNEETSVICLSTGTKCINGEQISITGSVLNDSHAEIVTRRCFVFWLYSQLQAASDGDESTVFEPAAEGGFRLKPGITFHLFISTAPCGDARIFSLHEEPANGTNILTGPVGKCGDGTRGKLRSKVESGMGTVPLPDSKEIIQTWDGVVAGERLLTMSCSDKILRWNAVGSQGALLTHWIPPVYFTSVSVGSRFHPGHMARALYERIECGPLPKDFEFNRPSLLATTSPESRQVVKPLDYCVNWVEGSKPEIINGATGRTVSGGVSRLCKKNFYQMFQNICRTSEFKSRTGIDKDFRGTYLHAKLLAEDFQTAKKHVEEQLKNSGAGSWVSKPVEQDQFYI